MRQTLSQQRSNVDETITRTVPEIESTTDKIHTQAEWITSLFPWLNNRRRDKHSHNGETMSMRQSPCRSVPELERTIDKMHTQVVL